MTPNADQVAALVASFQADLRVLSDCDVVHKHILTGVPVVVPEPAYFEIRNRTARHFTICPSEVLIVGSCRTGFSIKDEHPYRPARIDSDIDVTIVSETLFQRYWEAVFQFANSSHEFRSSETYTVFAKDLARGWIMPRGLPRIRAFPEGEAWVTFFNHLRGQRVHGPEPRNINAKLYRSWGRLQTYQEIQVRKRRYEITRPRR